MGNKKTEVDLEQHFLDLKDDRLEKVILSELSGKNFDSIVELGAGKGDFTKTFMKSGIPIFAYEIDPSLMRDFIKNTTAGSFIVGDIKDGIPVRKEDIIIAAPPYSLLEFINDEYIKKHNLNYILMVSQRYLEIFDGSRVIYTLSGEDFKPFSRGKHYIVTNLPKS